MSEAGLKQAWNRSETRKGRELQVITVIDDKLNSSWDIPGQVYNIFGENFLNLHHIVLDYLFPVSNYVSMPRDFPAKLFQKGFSPSTRTSFTKTFIYTGFS